MSVLSDHIWEIEFQKAIELDPVERLRNAVEAVNRNVDACGAEMQTTDGQWVDITPRELTSRIKLRAPKGETVLEEYRRIEASAAKIQKKLGELQYELI